MLPPVFEAISRGNLATTIALLEARADPNLEYSDGVTPLLHAVQSMDVQIIDTLLKFGANPDGPETEVGQTPSPPHRLTRIRNQTALFAFHVFVLACVHR